MAPRSSASQHSPESLCEHTQVSVITATPGPAFFAALMARAIRLVGDAPWEARASLMREPAKIFTDFTPKDSSATIMPGTSRTVSVGIGRGVVSSSSRMRNTMVKSAGASAGPPR
ncbi:hypothetical protein SCWH03_22440 [Streptomyces pacificus]|uniref:Uncharacterized protein n=1 Tax=Streptomyces pacificus TaxID=2705029 RepID=A0A6A0AT33_9ACTN|nr:hypothetical protein SCWH03_22440 [Streptomyces pacificus]